MRLENNIKLFNCILISVIVFSCNGINKNKISKHEKFYEVLNSENKVIGYNCRSYVFNSDTINENFFALDIKGRVLSRKATKFMKIHSGIAIFSKIDDIVYKNTFFLTKKDSCFFVQQQFNRFDVCYKGLTEFKNYKNVHKILYEDYADDGSSYTMILDKDFTLIAKFENNNNTIKEIILKNDNSLPKSVIKNFQSLSNSGNASF